MISFNSRDKKKKKKARGLVKSFFFSPVEGGDPAAYILGKKPIVGDKLTKSSSIH